MTVPERVVFDTNVWISGFLWRGAAHKCLLLAKAGIVQVVYCQECVAELSTKLREKFGYTENNIQAVVYQIHHMGEPVAISGNLHVVSHDADDDKFVTCAVSGEAAFIVSGDHHLLDIGAYENIRMITPRECITIFSKTQ
jgi:uncharacterized protein